MYFDYEAKLVVEQYKEKVKEIENNENRKNNQ